MASKAGSSVELRVRFMLGVPPDVNSDDDDVHYLTSISPSQSDRHRDVHEGMVHSAFQTSRPLHQREQTVDDAPPLREDHRWGLSLQPTWILSWGYWWRN